MSIKLTYFDARGLAEPIRLILAYGGQDFEDIRVPVSYPPKVPADVKNNCPWGTLPIVEFEGKKLGQSLAITRYFAKKNKLAGKDDFEGALCDEYVDACRDFMVDETDEVKRNEKFDEVAKAGKERFLSVFESRIEANGGKHLVGNEITWADIYLAYVVANVKMALGKCVINDEFPAIKNLMDTVFNSPGIKEWVAKRPDTKF